MENVKLDYDISGSGDTVIVIENGLGGSMYEWFFVLNEIKKDATIITYHRAGYGKSHSSANNRTTRQIAYELDLLLEEIGIEKKIILVGHSFGGLCVQHYTKLYPQKVKGVVLVDGTSVDFQRLYNLNLPVLYSHIAIDKLVENWKAISKKSREELKKGASLSYEQALLPEERQESIKRFETDPRIYDTMASEMENWGSSCRDIKKSGIFPDIPLTVVARDSETSVRAFVKHGIPEKEAILYEKTWRDLQREQSLLSEKGKFIIAQGSDHSIHLEKPKVLVEVIREML